ncbi:hypothetical protein GJ496_008080 [Pomphorhynchus laevis]|nr:hypothetical protein GJ496_008080 [Pomphorhynchus laevis]
MARFYGCYILYSLNPNRKGSTYIGFTVNPNRRIRQHNLGKRAGGAWKTNGKGPWDMVLVVYGFPNKICALRFEWAWQNPQKSIRLKPFVPINRRFSLKSKLDILWQMLNLSPWSRLPLKVRWLNANYIQKKGLISQKPREEAVKVVEACNDDDFVSFCQLCMQAINSKENAKCPVCCTTFHILCLARIFVDSDTNSTIKLHMVPCEGKCPHCNSKQHWFNYVEQLVNLAGQNQTDSDA